MLFYQPSMSLRMNQVGPDVAVRTLAGGVGAQCWFLHETATAETLVLYPCTKASALFWSRNRAAKNTTRHRARR